MKAFKENHFYSFFMLKFCGNLASKNTIMNRRKMILGLFASVPLTLLANPITWYHHMRNKKGFKVDSGEARFGIHYKMKGVTLNTLDIKISGEDTQHDLAVFEQTGLTPNGGPPLHIHSRQDEWFYVIEGDYQFQVGDDRFQMKAGDTIFLPRKVPHAFIQLSEKGKMIVSYLPAGKMEAFFAVTDKWTSPPNKEEIAKVFAAHDMEVVGPPLKVPE
jgi:mannose-6-phosphate isomerase-like protein (cupin superfamily)